ncbi:MAG: T9SS type A sorting domain-containing protein [Candidatus Cloacimonetes bacterium]|nr:T9SS type A sorting domain-containing protein [Candidatus Cloacimonadota bacterium]
MKNLVLFLLLVATFTLSAQPHPVYVELRNSQNEIPLEGDITFQAWLHTDPNDILTEDTIDCYYPAFGSYVKVNCGQFSTWNVWDVLFLVVTEVSSGEQGWGTYQLTNEPSQIFSMDDGGITLGYDGVTPELNLPAQFTTMEEESCYTEFQDYISGCFTNLTAGGNEHISVTIAGYAVTFIPAENWNGSEIITFEVTGIDGTTDTGSVEIIVDPVNDPPDIDLPEQMTFVAGSEATVDFAPYLHDVDGDILSLSVTGSYNVLVSIDGYMVTFTCEEGWHGSEELCFSVDDGYAMRPLSDTVIINFFNINDTVISCGDYEMDAGESLTVSLETTEIFAEWEVIAFEIYLYFDPLILDYTGLTLENSIVNGGSIVGLEPEPGLLHVVYAYYLNMTGAGTLVELTFDAVCSGYSELDLDTVMLNNWGLAHLNDGSVTVNYVNIPPEIELPAQFILDEDTSLSIDLDDYITGDYADLVVTGGENIAASISGSIVTFDPAADWFGSEIFTVTAVGFSGETASDTVELIVNPVNDLPEIDLPPSLVFYTDEEATIDFTPFLNDVDGDLLIITVSGEEFLSVEIIDYMVTFIYEAGWHGSDELFFTVDDNYGARPAYMDSTVVSILFPDDTVFSCDTYVIDDGQSLTVPVWTTEILPEWNVIYFEILFNYNPQVLAYTNISTANSITNGGQILAQEEAPGVLEIAYMHYLPIQGIGSLFELEFDTVCNGVSELDFVWCLTGADIQPFLIDGEVIVNDVGIPHIPMANAGADFALDSGEIGTLNGSASWDPDGDELAYLWTAPPGFTIASPTEAVTPFTAPYVLEDTDYTILLTVSDAQFSATDQVTVTVNYVNMAPGINLPAQFILDEDTSLSIDIDDYIIGDYADFTVTGGENITAEISENIVTFLPAADWFGSEIFTVTAAGLNGETSSDEVTVVVNAVNDLPDIDLPVYITFQAEEPATIDFSPYLYDADCDILTISVTGGDDLIVEIIGYNVTFLYEAGWHGSDELCFTVNDGAAMRPTSDNVTVNIFYPEDTILYCDDYVINLGDALTVPINTTEIFEEWSAISFELSFIFDPQILQFTGFSLDNSILSAGNFIVEESQPGSMMIYYANALPISGVGILAELDFAAACCGNSVLDLDACILNNWGLSHLIDGSVLVFDSGLPYPPIADAGADFTIDSGETGTLDGSASYDPNGDELSFQWNAPPEIIIENPTQAITQFTAPVVTQDTDYQVTLSVSDGQFTVLDTVLVTVNYVNQAQETELPAVTELFGAFPNPFNPETNVAFSLNEDSRVNISIFNIRGQKVAELIDEQLPAGYHNIIWQADNNPSGVYFLKMQTGDYQKINKTLLLK